MDTRLQVIQDSITKLDATAAANSALLDKISAALAAALAGGGNAIPAADIQTLANEIDTDRAAIDAADAKNTTPPAGTGTAPTGISASQSDSGIVAVAFNAAVAPVGQTVTGYMVKATPGDGVTDFNDLALGTSHGMVGMVQNTAYTFIVTALYSDGTTQASLPSASYTPLLVVTSPSTISTATATAQAMNPRFIKK